MTRSDAELKPDEPHKSVELEAHPRLVGRSLLSRGVRQQRLSKLRPTIDCGLTFQVDLRERFPLVLPLTANPFAELLDLVSGANDKQPIARLKHLEWTREQHSMLPTRKPNDLDAGVPSNIELGQHGAIQTTSLGYLDRFQSDFLQKIGLFCLRWSALEKRSDSLHLVRFAQYKQ